MTQLKNQAIQTALLGKWDEAIVINQSMLDESPEDIDTLNRLAFAHASLGNGKEAKALYQKVLTLDAQNPIALRNLKRVNEGSSTMKSSMTSTTLVSNLFIEEPGKTKVIELVNVADKKVIAPLRSGETLLLGVKRMKIFLNDQDKQYIGMLPDDVGTRLIRFIEGGNTYDSYVKSVENNKVTVFIREVKRVTKFKNQPSFLSTDRTKLFSGNKSPKIDAGSEDKAYDEDDTSEPEEE